ncbi:MAG: hypothetical protein PHW65_06100 [Dehalococcoidales bacterium]|nr:hypothetical protein [Dehalococcoidales bacterium]
MTGWVSIHRTLSENRFWKEKPFSRGQAWVDMILIANHKKGYIRKRGVLIEINRGQIGVSIKGLADRWGWSRGKVRRFMHELEMDRQIEQQNSNVTTLITLINYDKYQKTDSKTDSKRTANGQQTDTNNKVNNVNNENNEKKKSTSNEVSCPHLEIVNQYNKILGDKLPKVIVDLWNGPRKRNLAARWKEDKKRQSLDWWSCYFSTVKATPFLAGENDKGWKADMAWLVKQENMTKVLEGKYDGQKKHSSISCIPYGAENAI